MFLASPSVFLSPLHYITTFARWDFTSAVAYSMFISVGYAIFSLIKLKWLAVFLCALVIYDSIFGNIASAFETADNEQNILRVVHRYLKYKNKNIKKIPESELQDLVEHYYKIVNRLNAYNVSVQSGQK